jgi:hypothetical protein
MTGLEFTQSPYWLLLIVPMAAGLAWLLYSRTRELLPPLPRWLLTLFRFLVLLLVGLLFLDPRWQSLTRIEAPPVVAIVQDDSESIVIHKDSNEVRSQLPARLRGMIEKLEDAKVDAEFFSFGEKLNTEVSPDSLTYSLGGTDISGALEEVRRLYANQNLGAVILLTDGIPTAGLNPLYATEAFSMPIFPVMMGDTTPQRDIGIAEVMFNELAYLDTETPIRVKVRTDGYDNQPLQVTLTQGPKVIGTQAITLSKAQPQGEVQFLLKPDKTGIQQLGISVTTLPDEITHRNNFRTIFLNVLETKVKVAFFAGFPHPDVTALRAALISDKRFEVIDFVHKNQREYYTSPEGYNLADFDLFVLHNYPFSAADAPQLERIRKEIEGRNAPLMFFAGQYTDLKTLTPLNDHLGIAPVTQNPATEEAILHFKDEYTSHSTYTFPEGWMRLMNSAPPVYRNRSDWRAKGDTRVFATATIKGVTLDYPIYGLQQHLGRKNMVFVGENLWRIRSHVLVETGEFEAFDSWLYNNIQWLMVREDKRKFRVSPGKLLYSGGEPVLLKGQVYDDSYNPMPGVVIEVKVTGPGGYAEQLFLTEPNPANYFLELSNLAEGTYSYTATGTKNDVKVGDDRGEFSIGRSDIEHFRLTADHGLLRQIALRTRGQAFAWKDMDAVADEVLKLNSLKPVVSNRVNRIGFQDFIYVFVLLLAMLAVEWVVRKRYSLI